MKFDQLIEYNKINIFLQKLSRKWGKKTSSRPLFILLKKLNMRWKQVVCSLVSTYFDSLNLSYNRNKLYKLLETKLWTIYPEICSILIFQKRVWDLFLYFILCMIFQEKCFSCYILLNDQISMSDSLYFSRYWTICVSQLFVNLVVTSQNLKLTISFDSSCFGARPKSQDKSWNIVRTTRAFKVK